MVFPHQRQASGTNGTQQSEAPGALLQNALYEQAEHNRANGARDERLAKALGWFSIALGVAEVAAPQQITRLLGVHGDRRRLLRMLGTRELASGAGILIQRKPAGWLWSRVGGDIVDLALLGTALASPGKHTNNLLGATAMVGAITVLDLRAARRLSQQAGGQHGVTIAASVTIDGTPEALYRRWREPETLARSMAHFAHVSAIDETRTHWDVQLPGGHTIDWTTETIQNRPGEELRWRSLPGAKLPNQGAVRFSRAAGDRGTIVTLQLRFDPPGGLVSGAAAKLGRSIPTTMAKQALRRFKSLVETGEIPTSEPQPAARDGGRSN